VSTKDNQTKGHILIIDIMAEEEPELIRQVKECCTEINASYDIIHPNDFYNLMFDERAEKIKNSENVIVFTGMFYGADVPACIRACERIKGLNPNVRCYFRSSFPKMTIPDEIFEGVVEKINTSRGFSDFASFIKEIFDNKPAKT